MDSLLASLLSYLLLYKYVAVFVIVLLSGLVLPLPANTLLLAAGAFASQGYLNAFGVFTSAFIANVIGDSLGYSLTRIWGTRIITEAHLARFSALKRFERFIREYAGRTIIVTRFLGTPAVIVNFMAGLSELPYKTFILFDGIGNALSTASFLYMGYRLGVYAENYSDITEIIGGIVIVALLIFVIIKLFYKKESKIDNSIL